MTTCQKTGAACRPGRDEPASDSVWLPGATSNAIITAVMTNPSVSGYRPAAGGGDGAEARPRIRCFNPYPTHMKNIILIVLLLSGVATRAASDAMPAKVFDEQADLALQAMAKRAEELKIKGAAVVAYIPGEDVRAWSSKMLVVGTLKNAPTEKDRGANLLAIAYAKATEMAETLKDSGTAGRPPMTGETGWKGGLIKKCRTGYVLAAFSGGPSEADLKVSQAGLAVLAEKL